MYQDYGNWQQLNPSLRPADFKVNVVVGWSTLITSNQTHMC